ncbi:MAG: (5-formylfuran-3-yl)methyl phosphate synthase [Nitrososphaerales archaeon]
MKFLVSVTDKVEALRAYRGGADIIDIKNPKEGSVGANYPWIIDEIVSSLKGKVEISATIGDLNFLPGMASLACYAALKLKVDYVKAGFYKLNLEQAKSLAKSLSKTLEMNKEAKLVMVSFADYKEFRGLSYWKLLEIAKDYFDGFLLDLKLKGERCLFDYLKKEELIRIRDFCRNNSLIFGMAGGLKFEHLKMVKDLEPDVFGVRRGVLDKLKVSESLVRTFIKSIRS